MSECGTGKAGDVMRLVYDNVAIYGTCQPRLNSDHGIKSTEWLPSLISVGIEPLISDDSKVHSACILVRKSRQNGNQTVLPTQKSDSTLGQLCRLLST